MEGHAPTTRMISEGDGERASDLQVKYDDDERVRPTAPVHESFERHEKALDSLGAEIASLIDELQPVLGPHYAEDGDTRAMPDGMSPHRERIERSTATVETFRDVIAMARRRLEV